MGQVHGAGRWQVSGGLGRGGRRGWEAGGWMALPRRTGKAVPIGGRRDVGLVTKLLVKGGGERKGRDKKRGKKKKKKKNPACQA